MPLQDWLHCQCYARDRQFLPWSVHLLQCQVCVQTGVVTRAVCVCVWGEGGLGMCISKHVSFASCAPVYVCACSVNSPRRYASTSLPSVCVDCTISRTVNWWSIGTRRTSSSRQQSKLHNTRLLAQTYTCMQHKALTCTNTQLRVHGCTNIHMHMFTSYTVHVHICTIMHVHACKTLVYVNTACTNMHVCVHMCTCPQSPHVCAITTCQAHMHVCTNTYATHVLTTTPMVFAHTTTGRRVPRSLCIARWV